MNTQAQAQSQVKAYTPKVNGCKIRTIDIHAKQWFDKVNGNSYFSARVTLNFGHKSVKTISLPFQYGYGDHYRDMAFQELIQLGIFKDAIKHNNGSTEGLHSYCERHKITMRYNKQTDCLKRDVVSYGTN